MKFKNKDIIYALDIVKDSVDKRDIIPMLQHVLFDKTRMVAYNRFTTTVVDGIDLQGMRCLVPFARIYTFLKSLKTDEVEITITGDTMELRSGRANLHLALMPPDEYPNFDHVIRKAEDEGWQCPTDDFIKALKYTLPFVSKDRPEITGVLVSGNNVWATDSKRIAVYACKEKPVEGEAVITGELAKLLTTFDTIDLMYIDETKALFRCGDTTVIGAVRSEGFPQVGSYIPDVADTFEFPKAELIEGLKRVGNFTEEPNDQKFCTIKFGETLGVSYEGKIAEIKEYFNFGQVLTDKPFMVNPYNFLSLLDRCDRFTFCKRDALGLLYGQTLDGSFKAVIASKFVEK